MTPACQSAIGVIWILLLVAWAVVTAFAAAEGEGAMGFALGAIFCGVPGAVLSLAYLTGWGC